jgi:hypothetical protein
VATESLSLARADVGLRAAARAEPLILIGAIFALVGISVPFVTFSSLVLSWIPFPGSLAFTAVGAGSSLLLGIGGFLIFLGFAQARPDSLPWTMVVAVSMIAAGATGAIAGVAYILLWRGTLGFPTADFGLLNMVALVGAASVFFIHASLIVGLFVLARTFLRNP